MADPLQDSIVDTLKASSAELFDELLLLTQEAPQALLAKIAKANKDENLKVETSSHHEAFANLCLEVILLSIQEVREEMLERYHVQHDSPYLLLLSKYDYGGHVGSSYVVSNRQRLEYFASHGVVNYLAAETNSEAQKKAVLLALTSNPRMRQVVELTFESIAGDEQLEGYLQDLLCATLILQHTRGHSPTNELTKKLCGLPPRVKDLDLSSLLVGSMQRSDVKLTECIWGEIYAAFDVHAEDLQEVGWFIDLHPFTYSFSADGWFSEETLRDSPVLDHISTCLEQLDEDTRDEICQKTTHLLLPSCRQLDEDKFITAYEVSSHSWALAVASEVHLCVQTRHPEDMPAALHEEYSGNYQAIDLDFRSQNVHDESYPESVKWAFDRCQTFLNPPEFANTTSEIKILTVSVNNDTLLQDLLDRLPVNDNRDFTITFNGGTLYLRELKDNLTRHKMVQFQRTIVRIPNELNKKFLQRDLYKLYPDLIRCMRIYHESERLSHVNDSLGHTDPSLEDISSGVARKTRGIQEGGSGDAGYEGQGGRVKTAGSSTSQLKPSPNHLASSVMQGAVGKGEDGFTDDVLKAQSRWQKEARSASKKKPENSKAPSKARSKALVSSKSQGVAEKIKSNNIQGEAESQAQSQDDPIFNLEPGNRDAIVGSKRQQTMRWLKSCAIDIVGEMHAQDHMTDSITGEDLEPTSPLSYLLNSTGSSWIHSMGVDEGSRPDSDEDYANSNFLEPDEEDTVGTDTSYRKSKGQIGKLLHNIGDDLKLTKVDQDQKTDVLAEADLTAYIGRAVRRLGDACWKELLWYQNTGVRVCYTATVAVLTWGAMSSCTHVDLVPELVFNRKLGLFN